MNPIILALDYSDLSRADDMVAKVKDHIGMVKIGTELWAAYGPKALELGGKYNLPIFLDLKLHDIPNTVARTVDVIVTEHCRNFDIRFLSVHAFGSHNMLKRAVSAARFSTAMKIAAVTVLTSLDSHDMRWLGFSDSRENIKTADLAINAHKEDVRTFVCSPKNCKLLRKHLDKPGDPISLICPGIRVEDSVKDDQKRTSSVNEAIRNGATWLVIGRPITQSTDPAYAAASLESQAMSSTKSVV